MAVVEIEKTLTHWSITLNRPGKLNALCERVVEDLIEAFDAAQQQCIPVIALKGEGRCFSAGFDMTDISNQSEGDLLLRFVRIEMLLNKIATSPCFTLVFAHGKNFGAGVDLIGACDMRIAAPDSTFRMPGLKFGLLLGAARFARIVGVPEARRILAASITFNVERALQNGFIELAAESDRFETIILGAVERLKGLPADSRLILRQALSNEHADSELAGLVRSTAVPGIHQRIQTYLTIDSAL